LANKTINSLCRTTQRGDTGFEVSQFFPLQDALTRGRRESSWIRYTEEMGIFCV